MRRFLLGDENRFVESAVGRITLCVLFTTLVGVGLTLVFVLPARFSPFLLKFVVLIGTGLAASFITRRLLAARSAALRTSTALFACLIALAALSPLTQGFVGLNMLRHYAIATPVDAAVQLIVVGLAAAAGQVAWAPRRHTVLVEPREPVDVAPAPAAQPSRVRATLHAAPHSVQPSGWQGLLSRLFPPPTAPRKLRSARPAHRSRGASIRLSSREQHVCPYCLEPVTRNDRRGVKICKICKTWHHADCWEITGVCQVPHAFEN